MKCADIRDEGIIIFITAVQHSSTSCLSPAQPPTHQHRYGTVTGRPLRSIEYELRSPSGFPESHRCCLQGSVAVGSSRHVHPLPSPNNIVTCCTVQHTTNPTRSHWNLRVMIFLVIVRGGYRGSSLLTQHCSSTVQQEVGETTRILFVPGKPVIRAQFLPPLRRTVRGVVVGVPN